jgi:hypothetical protein
MQNWEDNPSAAWRAMDTHFAAGTLIGIQEPYLKQFADGSNGVRVDDPSEVLWLNDLGPTDVSSWHSEGNSHFRLAHHA